MFDSNSLHNHMILLIKAVAETYLKLRYRYVERQFIVRCMNLEGTKSKIKINKVVLFSGI